ACKSIQVISSFIISFLENVFNKNSFSIYSSLSYRSRVLLYLNSLDGEEVGMKMKHNYQHMYDLCKQHMHSYVLAETHDGSKVDGIITGVDDEYVYMAVPIESQ